MWPNTLHECLLFFFGYMEVPKEMECDTPREQGPQGAYELEEKARSSGVPSP